MLVEQIMNRPVHTCRADDTLNTAAHLMWDHDCGCVPVVDDDGRPIGVVTDRDIAMAAYTQGEGLEAIRVRSAMATKIVTCEPSTPIEDAQALMAQLQIRRLPVIGPEGQLVGMLSLNDVAREAVNTRGGDPARRRVTETLAAICEPRHARLSRPELTLPVPREIAVA